MEYWKPIRNAISRYGRFYWVSNLGRFKNGYGKILGFHKHKKGYLLVNLPVDGKMKRVQTHRVVAKMFIPNPDKLPQVNHIDCDKTNNTVSNLQWCTNKENAHHAIKTGTFSFIKPPKRSLSEDQINMIRNANLNKDLTGNILASRFNVSRHLIYSIRSGNCYK